MVRKAVEGVRAVNHVSHYIAAAGLLAMLAITLIDIIGRSVFNQPFSGTVEITPLLLVIVVFLGLAEAEHHGDHIAVDLVYSRCRPGVQKVLSAFAQALTVVVLFVLIVQIWRYAGVQQGGGYTTATLEWPIHWFVRIAALGMTMMLLATAVEIVAGFAGIDGPSDDTGFGPESDEVSP